MPIKSYIAFPKEGKKEELVNELNTMSECEAIPSQSHDLVLVVTDTTEDNDKILIDKINTLNSLQHISFVSGFAE